MLSHHAYIYEGDVHRADAIAEALRASERFGAHDPNFVVRHFEKFGIDDARALGATASLRSSGGRALFIIAIAGATTEAQQALLKLLEEPQRGVVFVLIMPHGMILPTLRSRCLELTNEELKIKDQDVKGAKAFLALGYKERSAEVARIIKESADDRGAVRTFINDLEQELYTHIYKKDGVDPVITQALRDIATLRTYLSDRSPSLKMILEHLAASLPKI